MTKIDNNIRTLEQGLKSGEHYEVKNDQIVKRSGFWSRIKYFFIGKKIDAHVQAKISETVKAVIQDVPKYNEDRLKNLFLNRLSKLSDRLFDRSVIGIQDPDPKLKELRKKLASILHPELKQTEQKLTQGSAEELQRKLDRRIEKVRLGIKLGVELKPISAGNSGSYLGRDYKVKILGVFKPGREESLGAGTPKIIPKILYYVKKYLCGIDTAAPFWANEGYVAEALTSKFAERMGFTVVPESKIATLNSTKFARSKKTKVAAEEGSFQRFVSGTKSAQDVFKGFLLKTNSWRHKQKVSEALKQEQFEQMALLDFAICNRDRHFENWLLKKPEGSDTYDIHAIDHQLAWPKVNPPKSDTFYRRNQYKWAIMPQAEKPFSDEMKELAVKQLRGDALKAMIEEFRQVTKEKKKGQADSKEFNTPFEGTSQELAFKQRIAVLLIAMNRGLTLKKIAEVKSQEEIDQFFVKYNGTRLDETMLDEFLGLKYAQTA